MHVEFPRRFAATGRHPLEKRAAILEPCSRALAVLLLVCGAAACSSDGDDEAPPQCTALRAEQPVPQLVEDSGAPLPATGGTIEEGSYRLTAVTAYVAPGSLVLPRCGGVADALLLSNGRFEHAIDCYFIADDPNSRSGRGVYAGSYETAATDFTFGYTCPGAKVETFQYSVEPPTLRMIVPDPDDPVTTELVWTLE